MLEDYRHHDLLTYEQEVDLGQRIQAGDRAAREELAEHNLRLVYSIARKFQTDDQATEFDDLVQIGVAGLMIAIDKYDPVAHPNRFSTYAVHWIRQAIGRSVVRDHTIKRSVHRYDVLKGAESRARYWQQQQPVASLDAPLPGGRDDERTLLDVLPSPESVEHEALRSLEVDRILAHLSDHHQRIIRAWMNGATVREAGESVGLSRGMVALLIDKLRRKEVPEMAPRSNTCLEPGCDQPKWINDKGVKFARCEDHQKEYWKAAAAARKQREQALEESNHPHTPDFTPQVRPGRSLASYLAETNGNGKSAPAAASYNPYREAGVWSEFDPPAPETPPAPAPEVTPVAAAPSVSAPPLYEMERGLGGEESLPDGCICSDCIYREVVSLISAKNPRVEELVQALESLRRLRDDLGI